MKLRALLLVTRAPFLILTPSCILVGFASALHEGYFNALNAALALLGSLLFHVSVNVLNEYYDYKRGTDLLTRRTPFSGGSGALPLGLIDPSQTFRIGVGSLILGAAIGCYFIFLHPILLPIVAAALAIVYFYTPILVKVKITELFPGLGFGPLLVVGGYITQLPKGLLDVSPVPVLASIPVGLLVSNLLFLNEFPDYEADLATGRMHGVIALGRKKASKVYVSILSLVYASIAVPVIFSLLPTTALISLATLPLAAKASKNVLENYEDIPKLIPSLTQNAVITLLTPVLLALGLIL